MGLDATKPVFGVSDKARHKPVPSAAESESIWPILVGRFGLESFRPWVVLAQTGGGGAGGGG